MEINHLKWKVKKPEDLTKIKCLKCGDIIFSPYPRYCIMCSCGSCGVDEADDYCRIIGNRENFEIIQ